MLKLTVCGTHTLTTKDTVDTVSQTFPGTADYNSRDRNNNQSDVIYDSTTMHLPRVPWYLFGAMLIATTSTNNTYLQSVRINILTM